MRFVFLLGFLSALSLPGTAHADYVIWLDFSTFNLDAFDDFDAVCTNEQLVEELVVAEVVRNYAAYEVQITTLPPSNHHVKVAIGGADPVPGRYRFGTSDPEGPSYSFNNWQTQYASLVEVYTDEFAEYSQWQGADGTCSRIANTIANTASHESGHTLWLRHENANDSCPGSTVVDVPADDPEMHIMALGLIQNFEIRASVDTTFTPNCSNVILSEELKPKGYHTEMGNIRGSLTWSDLLKLEVNDLFDVDVWVHQSLGSSLNTTPILLGNTLRADSIYLLGDTTGDGKQDLLEGVGVPSCGGSCTVVYWFEYENAGGNSLSIARVFSLGEVGDRFRLADIDGDGDADLIRGSANSTDLSGTMRWSAKKRAISSWTAEFTMKNPSAGPLRPTWVVDGNGDGRADLVRAVAVDGWARRYQPSSDPSVDDDCTDPSIEDASSRLSFKLSPANSLGSAFMSTVSMRLSPNAGQRAAISMFGDLSGDGSPDLIQGFPWTSPGSTVRWNSYSGTSTGALAAPTTANFSLGEDGQQFRIGNIDGDSRVDLIWAEPDNAWRWRRSWGEAPSVLSNDGSLRGTTDDTGTIYP